MSGVRLEFKPNGISGLAKSESTAERLGAVARVINRRVVAPRHLSKRVRWGVSRRGAFAQVIMRGPGAVVWEFGGLHNPPHAPLRNALRGGR